jgi:hypothetical protein
MGTMLPRSVGAVASAWSERAVCRAQAPTANPLQGTRLRSARFVDASAPTLDASAVPGTDVLAVVGAPPPRGAPV